MTYSILTPYLVPPGKAKAVNAGDGFIYDSVQKLVGTPARHLFSSWAPLSDSDIEKINATSMLVVAGANTLKDDFTICPGFDLDVLDKLTVPVALCGLGHYGVAAATQGLSAKSIQLLDAFLERFPQISVRCDESLRYLVSSAPHLEPYVQMTSCPVVFPLEGQFDQFEKKDVFEQVVVTLTDRAQIQQQLPVLPAVPKFFKAKRYVLALHQDYGHQDLWAFAEKLGYSVFRSPDYQAYIDLYKQTDLHFGNRLHAHLKCLSLGRPSFLLPFDLRQTYFAQSLDFPLIDKLPSPEIEEWNFAAPQARIDAARKTMDGFMAEVTSVLDGNG